MTIYKPKPADRKADVQKSPLKAVVVDNVKSSKSTTAHPQVDNVYIIAARRRRGAMFLGCCVVFVVLIMVVTAVGGYFIYHRLTKTTYSQHTETAQFKYYQYQQVGDLSGGERRRVNIGSFTEKIEIEDQDYMHERLDVPPILESRRSTVVHDFEKNLTAIVDRDMKRCFVMPLNRTAVQPPRSFFDLLVKYKSGYYLPDAEVVRDNYKVQLPVVENVDVFGFYIWSDCQYFDTYRLVHDDFEPRMVSKRSACELAGETYCLGGISSSANQMMCLKLTSCT